MKIAVKNWKTLTEEEKNRLFQRSEIDITDVESTVSEMIEAVRSRGDAALREYNTRFDGVRDPDHSLRVTPEEFDEAERLLDDEVKKALAYAIDHIRRFHKQQIPEGMVMQELHPGLLAGERPAPIPSVGLYVPRGRGSFPSMLYMLAIPAVLAKVPRIAIVTPPDADGKIDPGCLYAARLCGTEEIYKTGGSQAIAALAYGTQSVPRVAKVIGPGSRYVAAAKRLLYSRIDVGLPAGPSESAILADASADPWTTTLDLMVEAEHGSDSSALLVTPSRKLAETVAAHLESLIPNLPEPRRSFVTDVFSGYGGLIVTQDLSEAAEIINEWAPEHLQIRTSDPLADLSRIQNAGEILLGDHLPFSAANYATGINAVLPTGGRAKTFSAVSVRDFIKYSSVVMASPAGYADFKKPVTVLADYEGFVTHADALKKRDCSPQSAK